MRVEPSKANQNNKADQTVKNTESVFRPTPNANQLNTPPAPSSGAFEKIMNEARKSAKDDAASAKTENNSETNETSETKKNGEKEVAGKDNLKEREENKGGNSNGESGDENENPAILSSLGVFSNGKVSAETSALPAARSILHVADLERIVSTLRTIETKNSQQVLIALKNSVLEGLQIKLTIDANGKLKAEFLALNEQFKEQLKARKNELSEIFKNRGVKFSELEIKTNSESEKERIEKENLTKAAEGFN
jgi:hypothetical protein